MPGYQVQTDLDATPVGFLDEHHHIGIGSEPRVYLIKVDDVVATVKPSRFEYRIKPDGIEPYRLYIVEF